MPSPVTVPPLRRTYTPCTMSLLTLANVTCAYGTHVVLDGVTVSIEAGEKVGLIGRNGCGKTTIMRVMTGELQPDAGKVQLSRGAVVGYRGEIRDQGTEVRSLEPGI